jgi:CBS domain-containing protein
MTLKHAAKVGDYMTRKLVKLTPDMEVMKAVHQFIDRKISGAPVLDRHGNLVGVLSEKDCMKVLLKAGYYGEFGGQVSEYMHSPVETVEAGMPIMAVAERFASSPYRRFPVTEDGRLVGQISRSDVLRALQQLAEQFTDAHHGGAAREKY